ncbi:MAG: hypothetical protein KQA35_04460 [Candidatus Aenigmarchaeota archaeon]|nr:hypothetical protein [Candidatus Aenigmarchaeota archaeon]
MVETIISKCPFCNKEVITLTYYPSILKSKTSRTSSNSKTVFYKTKEKYEVSSDCPNCGKKAKEIQKVLNEGKKDPEKEKEILKRLEDQGLIKGEIKTKIR